VPDGIPIIRVSDVRNGQIATIEPLRVAREIEAQYARTRLRGGELLITIVGTIGETAIVPRELAGWNVARAIAVVPIRDDVGAYWARLALRSPVVRHIIDSRLNTTVQATLNLHDVAELPILLPPHPERMRIAAVLGALDDKIELNRRMNETLEAMARAIFKSWFVDFDPVRAKAEGRPPPGLSPDLAALFPDAFDEEDKPTGWSLQPLDEIAEFLNGLALQKYPPDNGESLPVIKISELRSGITEKSDRASS
jgi:type I restriction enzyme S subunit